MSERGHEWMSECANGCEWVYTWWAARQHFIFVYCFQCFGHCLFMYCVVRLHSTLRLIIVTAFRYCVHEYQSCEYLVDAEYVLLFLFANALHYKNGMSLNDIHNSKWAVNFNSISHCYSSNKMYGGWEGSIAL